MARTTDQAVIDLIINGSQAQQTLTRLMNAGQDLRKQLSAAIQAGDTKKIEALRREITRNDAAIKNMQASTQRIRSTMQNLDKATPKQLRETIKEINRQLNSGEVERGSKQWDEYTDALRRAKQELENIKNEQRAISGSEGNGKLLDLASVTTVATGAANAIGQAYSFMSRYVDEYAELAEHMAGVTKYTGLAKEDVDELNEAFKKMDTRTSQAALNDLAADAGRLGIQSKQEILDFVEAADQINTALGEDLGEGAVKEIGKLAQMFGDADTMGLKQAMLATGSVINELAQNSSAAEGYLMEFTSRLAGMGKTAGMSQSQIMGLASVMDQNKVMAEQGSTALSRLIQVMYREPAKMAQAAGMDVQQFCNLVKTDANEALLQFAEAVSGLGGMDKIAPMLGELSLTGQGASTVIATLAQNTALVRQEQGKANIAFQEATSVTNESAIANSTVQAQLEKSQQKFATLRAELGERLLPVQTALTNTLSGFFTVLLPVGSFLASHVGVIATLTASVVAYYTATASPPHGAKGTWPPRYSQPHG